MKKAATKSSTKGKRPTLNKRTVKDLSAKKGVKGGLAPEATARVKSVCWCRD